MRFKTIILWGALGLAGCADSSDLCQSIELGTPAEELPVADPTAALLGTGGQFQGPADDLECCHFCAWGDRDCGRCKLDCKDPALQASPVTLGNAYAGECGDWPGTFHCIAWMRDDKVVATQGSCAD
jgi:hypothetical protein